MTEINFKINDIKKQTEIVDQVLNRKRKESDVRNGLTKAFGRRAERLRQHVGVSDVYEDGEYARLKMEYDNNGVHLLIVSKDCTGYTDAMRAWVVKLCEMAVTAEAWVDVGMQPSSFNIQPVAPSVSVVKVTLIVSSRSLSPLSITACWKAPTTFT